jgi:hypothetical protein
MFNRICPLHKAMMLPTHAVVGLAIATPVARSSPEFGSVALAGALVGSVLPDLDLYAGHRRTLHYPTGYTVTAVCAAVVAVVVLRPGAVAVAFLLAGAAIHCRMDRYGGGLELRPWEQTSNRAVYDHVRGRWRPPKRWISYDGSGRDVLLLVLVGGPLIVMLEAPFRWVGAAAVLIGGTYALLRRRLATLAPAVFGAVPEAVQAYVPDRYR